MIMGFEERVMAPAASAGTAAPGLVLEAFTYEEKRMVLPAVSEAMTLSGSWLLERRAISLHQVELRFEMELFYAMDLYAALVETGLDLTRRSHRQLAGACTLRNFRERPAGVVEGTLVVSFLESLSEDVGLPALMMSKMQPA